MKQLQTSDKGRSKVRLMRVTAIAKTLTAPTNLSFLAKVRYHNSNNSTTHTHTHTHTHKHTHTQIYIYIYIYIYISNDLKCSIGRTYIQTVMDAILFDENN